jgi:hypothetical protein
VADVLYLLTLLAFFALMVGLVHLCERVVGKADPAESSDAAAGRPEGSTAVEEVHA